MKTDPLTNVCLMAYLLYLGKKCIIRLSCALGFTVLLMLAAFIVLILPFSIQGKPDNVKIIVHENTKAAVKDFPVFYVSKVTIFQSPVSSQSLHKMKFYLAENGCDRLPKNTRYSKPNESHLSKPPNKTMYLLKGSEMALTICAVTNDSRHYIGENLYFSIAKGLESMRNPHSLDQYTIDIGYSASLNQTHPIPGVWNCSKRIKYTVKENDYYSTITVPPHFISKADLLVWYNISYAYKVIDDNSLQDYCSDIEVHRRRHPCTIPIGSCQHGWIAQRQCVVVEINENVDPSENSTFSSVVIEFSNWNVGQSAFVGVGSSVLVISTLMFVFLFFNCYRAHKRLQPAAVTTN